MLGTLLTGVLWVKKDPVTGAGGHTVTGWLKWQVLLVTEPTNDQHGRRKTRDRRQMAAVPGWDPVYCPAGRFARFQAAAWWGPDPSNSPWSRV